jgi:hypothetical protein
MHRVLLFVVSCSGPASFSLCIDPKKHACCFLYYSTTLVATKKPFFFSKQTHTKILEEPLLKSILNFFLIEKNTTDFVFTQYIIVV